jgi:hypothetical protein
LAGRHDHELTDRKGIGVILQRLIQVVDLCLQALSGKPEKQDAGVRKALVKALERIPLGGFGETSSPVTIAFA